MAGALGPPCPAGGDPGKEFGPSFAHACACDCACGCRWPSPGSCTGGGIHAAAFAKSAAIATNCVLGGFPLILFFLNRRSYEGEEANGVGSWRGFLGSFSILVVAAGAWDALLVFLLPRLLELLFPMCPKCLPEVVLQIRVFSRTLSRGASYLAA